MNAQNNPRIAQFNTGMITAIRIGNLVNEMNIQCGHGNLENWNQILIILFREVSPKLNPNELQEGEQFQLMISPFAHKYYLAMQDRDQNRINVCNGQYSIVLHKFEIWIRAKLDMHGLGSPDSADAGSAIGRG